MDIRVTHEQSRVLVTILHISGAIDSSNYQELDQITARTIDSGARYILMDLSNVRFMSSAALRSLQLLDRKLNGIMEPEIDPRLRQRGPHAARQDAPELVRVEGILLHQRHVAMSAHRVAPRLAVVSAQRAGQVEEGALRPPGAGVEDGDRRHRPFSARERRD